ncbi:hypothetical protein BAE44_0016584 [Dichanthelium oligosanthes]|uniref:Transglycosylase SLT domain-containing protein n=1 Tax=Dichanthelium oligosanthes TaxID=888268 RepID=A0A1E5VB66_9POAL|nr:hypothetical protein BAE44_0016584 [Dichanthelium oligosanthes]
MLAACALLLFGGSAGDANAGTPLMLWWSHALCGVCVTLRCAADDARYLQTRSVSSANEFIFGLQKHDCSWYLLGIQDAMAKYSFMVILSLALCNISVIVSCSTSKTFFTFYYKMAISFKYWDDCLDPEDMKLMWQDPIVSKEWTDAGEEQGQKVHLSRDPDGEAYLTQTEMMAVAAITVHRHFKSQLDPYMIGALAEIASGRRLFVDTYDHKTKETKVGIMQVAPEIARWLGRELGYKSYDIEDNTNLLYWPLVNVYFGAAYAKWLFSCDDKQRTEEFVVRAYKGGKKKASHKSTAPIFQRYLYVKENLLSIRQPEICNELTPDLDNLLSTVLSYVQNIITYGLLPPLKKWHNILSSFLSQKCSSYIGIPRSQRLIWMQCGNILMYIRSGQNQAVAEIIISRHLSSRGSKPEALAALAEICSMRFVHGVIPVSFAKDCGYRAYTVISVDDLYNPFASMYFGASYLAWLSQYEGREQSYEFIVQAYLGGPENVSLQETGTIIAAVFCEV